MYILYRQAQLNGKMLRVLIYGEAAIHGLHYLFAGAQTYLRALRPVHGAGDAV